MPSPRERGDVTDSTELQPLSPQKTRPTEVSLDIDSTSNSNENINESINNNTATTINNNTTTTIIMNNIDLNHNSNNNNNNEQNNSSTPSHTVKYVQLNSINALNEFRQQNPFKRHKSERIRSVPVTESNLDRSMNSSSIQDKNVNGSSNSYGYTISSRNETLGRKMSTSSTGYSNSSDIMSPSHGRRRPNKNIILPSLDENEQDAYLISKNRGFLGKIGFISKILDRYSQLDNFDAVRSAYRMNRSILRRTERSPSFTEQLYHALDIGEYQRQLINLLKSRKRVFIFSILDLIVDLVLCINYMIEIEITQLIPDRGPINFYLTRPYWLWIIAVVFSCFNAVSLFLRIAFSDRIRKVIIHPLFLVDLVTMVPFIISATGAIPYGSEFYVPYFLRALTFRQRLKVVLGLQSDSWKNPLKDQLWILGSTILAIVYVGMCFFQWFEEFYPPDGINRRHNLVDSLYFIIITISTVGYGDVTAVSYLGRIVVIGLIVVSLAILPGLISETVETVNSNNTGRGTVVIGKNPFVVVCGVFDNVLKISDVLTAFLHQEHHDNIKVVFLARNELNREIKALLHKQEYRDRAEFIQGSSLSEDDLIRSGVKYAQAVFVMANRNTNNPREEDDNNTLRAWAISDFAPSTPLYVYNLQPETETYQDKTADYAICVDELKLILLGYNCLYRGSATLILNLLHQSSPYAKYSDAWKAQYGDGSGNELYRCTVNPIFIGKSFTKVSWFLYREFQVTLFALESFIKSKNTHYLMLNPGRQYIIRPGDVLIFIAQNSKDVYDINELTSEQYAKSKMNEMDDNDFIGPSNIVRRRSIAPETQLHDFPIINQQIKVDIPESSHGDNIPLCHVLVEPQENLEDSILMDATTMKNHLLIITETFDVFKLVTTLRSAHLTQDEFRSILFLSSKLPTPEQFERLCLFPQIYYMTGDYRQRKILMKAGIENTDKIVIMKLDSADGSGGEDDVPDSTAIMLSHLIYNMFDERKRKYVIVELSKRSNIRFLRPSDKPVHRRRKRISKSNLPFDYLYHPMYASGRVMVASMLDSILFQTYHNSTVLSIVKLFCGVREHTSVELDHYLNVNPAYLCYIDVPQEFVGLSYGLLYRELSLHQGIIPIGLFRTSDGGIGEGNQLPYVFTSPFSSILLLSSDLVYVLKHGYD